LTFIEIGTWLGEIALKIEEEKCNTPGVCHSLSSGFELKHDRLSGDGNVKVNLWR
jgi:hypothetical protein